VTDQQRDQLHARVENDFRYHRPDAETAAKHAALRDVFERVSHEVIDLGPPGRELSTALTKLEESMFHANAGLARSSSPPETTEQAAQPEPWPRPTE
jgi:hypothetical protein